MRFLLCFLLCRVHSAFSVRFHRKSSSLGIDFVNICIFPYYEVEFQLIDNASSGTVCTNRLYINHAFISPHFLGHIPVHLSSISKFKIEFSVILTDWHWQILQIQRPTYDKMVVIYYKQIISNKCKWILENKKC